MKVDPKCSVVISGLSEEECIPIPSPSVEVNNEPAVSGQDDQTQSSTLPTTIGVIVVVVVLIITIGIYYHHYHCCSCLTEPSSSVFTQEFICTVRYVYTAHYIYLLSNYSSYSLHFIHCYILFLYTLTQEWFKREGRRCYQDHQQ